VAYLAEENRVLREQLKSMRIQFTDDHRRRLAAKGKALRRKVLREVCTLVTPAARAATTSSTPAAGTRRWRKAFAGEVRFADCAD